jgi:hypothetical protein
MAQVRARRDRRPRHDAGPAMEQFVAQVSGTGIGRGGRPPQQAPHCRRRRWASAADRSHFPRTTARLQSLPRGRNRRTSAVKFSRTKSGSAVAVQSPRFRFRFRFRVPGPVVRVRWRRISPTRSRATAWPVRPVAPPCRRDGGPAGGWLSPVPRPACGRARAGFPPAAASLLDGPGTGRSARRYTSDIPRMYLRRTFHGPRLAPPVVAASRAGHDDPDASMPTGHFRDDGETRLCGLSPLASQDPRSRRNR